MSYKNAMAGLPLGGGKSVILADRETRQDRLTCSMLSERRSTSSRTLRHRRGRRHERLRHDRGRANDEVRRRRCPTRRATSAAIQDPHTSLGVFLGIKAAVKWALGKSDLDGLHIALQGAGSVATGVALHACAEGARLSIADVDPEKAKKLADRAGGKGGFHRRDPFARGGRPQPMRARRDPRRGARSPP